MPELPEVETIRSGLQKVIIGKVISNFWSDWPKKALPSKLSVQRKTKGKKIISVDRCAKILIIQLSGGLSILVHLKMTGQLIYQPTMVGTTSESPLHTDKLVVGGHPQQNGLDNLPNKFTHHYFIFTDGSHLFFNDVRKFGWIKLANSTEVSKLIVQAALEPIDSSFSITHFSNTLDRYPNRKIKQLLLDQKLISGLGNIYVDESLFASGVQPSRTAGKVMPQERASLYREIKRIIKKAIQQGGTSFSDYVDHSGNKGGYARYLKVYGRANQLCLKCKVGKIKRITIGGRGTHYCSVCQK